MNSLTSLFIERLSGGLRRKSLIDSADWAKAYRILGEPFPGKWTFDHHPWLEELHRTKSEFCVGQKSAQMGFTETMLNIVFFKIDIEQVNCLYVLPSKTPDAGDFSTGRFDPALELSPHIENLFSDVKNIGHKRAGSVNLYIRGSRSRAGLKSIPTGCIILDEVDEFTQENIELAFDRASGQRESLKWLISTPTIELQGINKFYEQSSKCSYFFRCPSCSRYIDLTFPESIIITGQSPEDPELEHTHLICKLCKAKLPHENKRTFLKSKYHNSSGEWVPEHTDREIQGFHINQLYSTVDTVKPKDVARLYLRSLYDPADEQTFYNSKLGLTHTVEGSKLTDHQIESCKGDYLNGESIPHYGLITMGIDVGAMLHYEVDLWHLPYTNVSDVNAESTVKVLEIGKVHDFHELDLLMQKFRVVSAVIDANPERRLAFEFAQRFNGHIKIAFYGQGIYGKQIHEAKTDYGHTEPAITVNRTSWLDLSLSRFRNGSITIPKNAPEEYKKHLTALTRIYERDKDGNPYGKYVRGTAQDHFSHARNYAEIALGFACYLMNPQSIRSPI